MSTCIIRKVASNVHLNLEIPLGWLSIIHSQYNIWQAGKFSDGFNLKIHQCCN